MNSSGPVGVCDAGLGGLTVVAQLQRLLPGEDIVYCGDNARNPYGNRPEDEIVAMTHEMLGFLREQGVKMVVVACNTISTLLDRYAGDYGFPILGIVQPASHKVAQRRLPSVGVIATNATISSQAYQRLIRAESPETVVVGKGSTWLANLVDRHAADAEIDAEIKENMDILLEAHPVEHVILGCTHYAIVQDRFERLYPGITFLDPALTQAEAAQALLLRENGLSAGERGGFVIHTNGSTGTYADFCGRLGCRRPDALYDWPVGRQP